MKITSFSTLLALSASSLPSASAYWLMGIKNFITTERLDPIVNPGAVSGHVHSVLGGSNFGFTSSTESLLKSDCTSIPIREDKSNYWFPHLYFQWKNGSFTSVDGGAVIYYLFDDKPGKTTAFPPDFRMISGSPALRTYDAGSFAQQAIDFLCLDFNGQTTKHTSLPEKNCPSGIRSQINFPSCWDGKNVDSASHKSHVAFRSEGPDKGQCTDPNFPVELPRIFIEVYWGSANFDSIRSQAMNPNQPFVFAHGDPTGYGNHADFFNGWQPGVLQRAVDGCTCNIYGDPTCCVEKGLFTMDKDTKCYITKAIDEQTTGTLPKLPGNNPVQPAGSPAKAYQADSTPGIISPVYAYTSTPTATGKVIIPPSTAAPTIVAPPPSSVSSSSATSSATVATTPTASATSSKPADPVTTPASSSPSSASVSSTSTSVAPSQATSLASSASIISSSHAPSTVTNSSLPPATSSSVASSAPVSSSSIASSIPVPSSSVGSSAPASSSVPAPPPPVTSSSRISAPAVTSSSAAAPGTTTPCTTHNPRTTYTNGATSSRAAQVTRSTAPPYVVPTPINAGAPVSPSSVVPAPPASSPVKSPPVKTCKKKSHGKHFKHHYHRRMSFDIDENSF